MAENSIHPELTEGLPPTRELDLESLKALSHPLRVQIVNALSIYGPATASGLGERFGESSGATSYHLRQLERHGFIREVEGKGTGRERWWERVPGALNIGSSAAEETPAGRSAAQLIFREFRQTADRLLVDFTERGPELLPHEWMDASEITTANARLTVGQLHAFVTAVNQAMNTYVIPFRGQQGEGTRAVQIHFNAFPVLDAEGPNTQPKPSGEHA
ncbi:MAG TPA: helix-turn-helix domain-containing protein [Pseudolysinimonas sp.]